MSCNHFHSVTCIFCENHDSHSVIMKSMHEHLQFQTKKKLTPDHEMELQTLGALFVTLAVTTARIQYIIENNASVHSSWIMTRLLVMLFHFILY